MINDQTVYVVRDNGVSEFEVTPDKKIIIRGTFSTKDLSDIILAVENGYCGPVSWCYLEKNGKLFAYPLIEEWKKAKNSI